VSAVLAVTRRVEFPGKRRLRSRVRVPRSGMHDVDLLGARFRLDLAESLHRDYFFGLCDQLELRLIERLLARGGDFVGVGAHISMYSVNVARRKRGRVLALEPNAHARAQLEQNLALNDCGNVTVEGIAASDSLGYGALHVPTEGDSSWSTLMDGRLDADDAVDETTTLDLEVARHVLSPAVVKIDVEGAEVDVLRGSRAVLRRRPALLVELVEQNAAAVVGALGRLGYSVARAGTRRLEPWAEAPGAANAVFLQQRHLPLLRRRQRRAFARGEEHVVGELGQAVCKPVEDLRDEPRRPGERRDRAEALARDADDLEAALLHDLA